MKTPTDATLLTALPEIVPNSAEPTTQILAGPARLRVGAAEIPAAEEGGARGNWGHGLAFRDRPVASGTLESCYLGIFR